MNIDISRGTGPDGIHSLLLKNCESLLTAPLTIIFNESLSIGYFPSDWKSCKVRPVFKKYYYKILDLMLKTIVALPSCQLSLNFSSLSHSLPIIYKTHQNRSSLLWVMLVQRLSPYAFHDFARKNSKRPFLTKHKIWYIQNTFLKISNVLEK